MAENVKTQQEKENRRKDDQDIDKQRQAEEKDIKQQLEGNEHTNNAFNDIENTTIDDNDVGLDP